jgi:protein gp37
VADTNIEWATKVWNPTRGCSRVNEGCRNCYAERQAIRHAGPGGSYEGLVEISKHGPRWTGEVRLIEEKLGEPLDWKKPQRIFVNSMSDLFHEKLGWERDIDRVWNVMAACKLHSFLVLTKRAENMRDYVQDWYRRSRVQALQNIWLGVSVEDQATADERIPLLLEAPAAVRFVSYEPALAPVAFREDWLRGQFLECPDETQDESTDPCMGCPGWSGPGGDYCGAVRGPHLDWVIVGGESGPRARPFDITWAYAALRQCREAGVACFVKQLGARPIQRVPSMNDPAALLGVHDRKGGDMAEWPENLRVREFPAGGRT